MIRRTPGSQTLDILRICAVCLVFCAALSLTGHADVERIAPPHPWPSRGTVTVEVIGDDRGSLPLYGNGGWRWSSGRSASLFVEAMRGERYRLRIRNESDRRIGLVIAVDGRNIITGDRSYLRSSEGMYILNPWGAGEFSGWRTSTRSVARFYFTDEQDSYAAAWGDSSQIGYITIAVFDERRPWIEERLSMKDEAGAPRASSKIAPDRMHESSEAGTGYGEHEYSPVQAVDFDAESFARDRISIRYDWPSHRHGRDIRPYDDHSERFAPPPPHRHD
ncbi:MAG TPA: hypothetical protein PLP29_13840 [Candidatus Ozemobacteraceae bacterium]|nr:hypothetical protein [Candidatus Ozemobacteraceae bacterium]